MKDDPLARSAMLDVLNKLIRARSVNPTLAPHEAHGETKIAMLINDWFALHNVESWLDEVVPGRLNVVGRVGQGRGPTLVFCAHLDTVSSNGMTIPAFEPRCEGDRVYGRGSYDMKGSIAAIMGAMAALALDPPKGVVLAALVADEEYSSLGAQHFVANYKADACVVTEPSEGNLILGHKGFVWVEIESHGRAAHGSRWDLGVSAIGKMGKIITALEEFDRVKLRNRIHPLMGPASQHSSIIAGGSGLSTYSESCKLKLERRTLPGETAEQVIEELHEVISSTGESADIHLLLDRPSLICERDRKIAACLGKAVTSTLGSPPPETGVSYWMDAALFAAAGIDTIDYGPSGAGAHEAVEWVDLRSVVNCAAVFIETTRLFCND